MKLRALLLDGHTIQALPMMKALTRLNAEVTIFCEDRISYGYFPDMPAIAYCVLLPRRMKRPILIFYLGISGCIRKIW